MTRTVEAFGRRLLVERRNDTWHLYQPGDDGKRRLLAGVLVPAFVASDEQLLQYLADLYHESARPDRSVVRWVG